MAPVYLPILEEMKVNIEQINLNDEKGKEFADTLGIQAVPVLLFIKDNTEVHTLEGFDTSKSAESHKEILMGLIKEYL